jgi:hypothetical protein
MITMNKCSLALLTASLLAGCITQKASLDESKEDQLWRESIMSSFNRACLIEYKRPSDVNYWQSPTKTKDTGKGDCKATAGYLYYLWDKKGIESKLIVGKAKEDDKEYHMWNELSWQGRTYWFDATTKLYFPVGKNPFGWYRKVWEFDPPEIYCDKNLKKNKGNLIDGLIVK